jgi:hypothetical protein
MQCANKDEKDKGDVGGGSINNRIIKSLNQHCSSSDY